MMQKWCGVGRLGKDAEVMVLPSGSQTIKFSIAVDDSYKGADGNWVERTYWIPCSISLPSLVSYYKGRLLKGTLVWIDGKLITYTYNDSNNQPRTGFAIDVLNMHIISKPYNAQQPYPNPAQQSNNNIPPNGQQNNTVTPPVNGSTQVPPSSSSTPPNASSNNQQNANIPPINDINTELF